MASMGNGDQRNDIVGTVERLDDYTVYEGRSSNFMGQYSVSVKRLWKATALRVRMVI